MITGTTPSGYDFSIEESQLDDWDLIETISDIEEGDPIKIVKAAKLLLGDDGLSQLKEHVRTKNGKVTVTAMTEEITAIFSSNTDLKNS
jgi:hypothetical protein